MNKLSLRIKEVKCSGLFYVCTSTRLTINIEEIGLRSGLTIRRKSGRILAEPEDFQTDDNTMAMKMIINGKSDLLLMPDSLTGVLLKR